MFIHYFSDKSRNWGLSQLNDLIIKQQQTLYSVTGIRKQHIKTKIEFRQYITALSFRYTAYFGNVVK